MKTIRRNLLVLAMAWLVALHSLVCSASIFMEAFPGFDSLIETSEAIWIVELGGLAESGVGIGDPYIYAVQVLKVLKGPKADLEYIGLTYCPYVVDEGGFARNTRYLVFLNTKGFKGRPDAYAGSSRWPATYGNPGTEGSHWEVSSQSNLDELSSMPLKQAIKLLLQESVAMKKRKAAMLEKAVKKALEKK
ncbi:MAG: hypothetical protein NT105_13570 [Verrucomicrobia bacterium]|nr:hypothetical protein [Verrucomicrobiota bacterium]